MLVLTRTKDEEIRIGDDIVIRVLDVKGDRVRIGIAAPASVAVHRQEVYLEIERANREALNVAGAGLKGAQELLEKKIGQHEGRPVVAEKKSGRGRKRKMGTEVIHGS